jgi:hypothetical protein
MQWMLGDAVLISPVILPNTTTITPYFTKVSCALTFPYPWPPSSSTPVTHKALL